MRKKYKICSLCLAVVMLFSCLLLSPVSVSAHEFSPPRYWNDIYYHSGMKKHIVRLKINMTNVKNSVYNRKLLDAINDWEWLDNGYCDMQQTTTGTTLMVYDSYPSSQNQNIYATTRLYFQDAYINQYYGSDSNMGPPLSVKCRRITKAVIYANRAKQASDKFGEGDIAKTWCHELGHVMGLNETNDGTRSVMKQGKGSTFGWSNYWQPQSHDTNDVGRYRFVRWG